MAISGVVPQHIQQGRPYPQAALLRQLQPGRHLIHLRKAEMQRFTAEQIGVFRKGLQRMGAIRPVHLHGARGGNAVLPKPGHHFPRTKLAAEFLMNGIGLFLIQPPNGGQLFRVLGNDVQGIGAEHRHDFFRRGRADVGQCAAGQIGLNVLHCLRNGRGTGGGLKLPPVGWVRFKMTFQFDRLADVNFSHHTGGLYQFRTGVYGKHHIAVILILKNQIFNYALKALVFLHGIPLPAAFLKPVHNSAEQAKYTVNFIIAWINGNFSCFPIHPNSKNPGRLSAARISFTWKASPASRA